MIEAAEQTASAPKPIYRKDYKPPDYLIPKARANGRITGGVARLLSLFLIFEIVSNMRSQWLVVLGAQIV